MKQEFKIISSLINENSKILDVGCGNGVLMKYILENISKNIRGLEISKKNVQECIEKGLTVIEGNAELDLGPKSKSVSEPSSKTNTSPC